MKVDFNNLRKQTAYAYDRLTKKLNSSIVDKSWDPSVSIDVDDIQEEMDDLRRLIMSICCVYIPDDEEFKDVSEEVEPIANFNDEDNM